MTDRTPFARLQRIMKIKNTKIILSCDVTTMEKLAYFANLCGPYICILKVHTDIIENFSVDLMLYIRKLAETHNFLIMEDRKFGDIGYTLNKQLTGLFKYTEWCDLVTAYPYIGQAGLDVFARYNIGVFLLAELSINEGQILPYKELFEKEENRPHPICGTIGQNNTGFLQATPGIHLDKLGDNSNQCYKSPEKAKEKGADLFIIGRAIYTAKDPLEATKRYHEATMKL
jgi:uridine monophosphate synthetase